MTTLASGPLKAKLFGKSPKGTTIGTPLVSPVASSAFGPGIVGYSLSVPITTQGTAINFTVTQLVMVKGRLGHQVTFTAWASRSPSPWSSRSWRWRPDSCEPGRPRRRARVDTLPGDRHEPEGMPHGASQPEE